VRAAQWRADERSPSVLLDVLAAVSVVTARTRLQHMLLIVSSRRRAQRPAQKPAPLAPLSRVWVEASARPRELKLLEAPLRGRVWLIPPSSTLEEGRGLSRRSPQAVGGGASRSRCPSNEQRQQDEQRKRSHNPQFLTFRSADHCTKDESFGSEAHETAEFFGKRQIVTKSTCRQGVSGSIHRLPLRTPPTPRRKRGLGSFGRGAAEESFTKSLTSKDDGD